MIQIQVRTLPLTLHQLTIASCIIGISLLSQLPLHGQDGQRKMGEFDETTLSARMEAAAKDALATQHLPGLAVVVVHHGKTVFSQGFGYANVKKKTPVDNEKTIFRIGSISKALTLLTLTRQIDQGRLERSQPVSDWINFFSNPEQIEQPITMDHLLTHTTGLDQIGGIRQVKEFHKSLAERKQMRMSLLEFLKNNNLRRIESPGRTHRYDTYGTSIAGFILGELHHSTYAEAMQKEMFSVLGMSASAVEVRDNQRSRLATGYGFTDEGYQERPYEVYLTTPASSIDATPNDMAKLLEALTSDGSNASGRFLSREMLEAVMSPQFRVQPGFRGMSHGLFESWTSDDGTRDVHLGSMGHGGNMDGFRSALTIIPAQKLGIFVVANRSPSAGGGQVDFRPLIDAVLDSIGGEHQKIPYAMPTKTPTKVDLREYAGEYYYGVFCHTMTAKDQGEGAWRRGRPNVVAIDGDFLKIRDERYLPRGDDLFVESGGERLVFFQRDADGKIRSFTYSTSPDTFERASQDYREFPSLAQEFYDLATEGNLDIAVKELLSADEASKYYVREEEFNNAGYALLNAGDPEAAIAAFQFNVKQFPNSWNAHDSLAEALADDGQTKKAIESYQRSIRLNSSNAAGRKRLQELQGK